MELKAQEIKTYPIESIDPDVVSYSDLVFLNEEIGDAQIVFLGEQDHGDGAAFLAKTRFIKYLVEEMGFSVIAFEGDFVTLNDNSKDLNQKWSALPGPWVNSDQMIPLKKYLDKRNIELAGFDLFATAIVKEGLKGFEELYWKMAAPLTTLKEEEIKSTVRSILTGAKANNKFLKEVYRITPLLFDQQSGLSKQLMGGFQYVIDSYQAGSKKGKVGFEKYSDRDTHMAFNLRWLMENSLAGKKVIVWAANFHIAKNPNSIESEKSWRFRSGNLISMGQKFDEICDIPSYRIGLTSYDGKYNDWVHGGGNLEIMPERHNENSLEVMLLKYPGEYQFVPLGGLAFDFSLSGFQHKAFRGDWRKVFDAIFFIKEMTPSTNEKSKKL